MSSLMKTLWSAMRRRNIGWVTCQFPKTDSGPDIEQTPLWDRDGRCTEWLPSLHGEAFANQWIHQQNTIRHTLDSSGLRPQSHRYVLPLALLRKQWGRCFTSHHVRKRVWAVELELFIVNLRGMFLRGFSFNKLLLLKWQAINNVNALPVC